MDPTHKPHPADVDTAWDDIQSGKLERAWDRYKDRKAEAERAQSDYWQALEDPTSGPEVEAAHRDAHHRAQGAQEEAAACLRRLGEDPELYDQGEDEDAWMPDYHHLY